MKLSIIIVTRRRLALLNRCLVSLSEAWLPGDGEVVVIVNGRDQPTEAFLASVNLPGLRVVPINEVSRSEARNIGIQFSSGEIIHFLDDDVVVPENLFAQMIYEFSSAPSVSIVGGPNLTPPESPPLEKLFGAIMASPFIAPWVNCRYRRGKRELGRRAVHRVILCNLAIRRAHLPRSVRFRTMTSNEENLLVHECLKAGGKAVYAPSAYVYHHRRATLRSFLAQVASYGQGRAEQTLASFGSSHLIFAVPALAIIALGGALFLGEYQKAALGFMIYLAAVMLSVVTTREILSLGGWAVFKGIFLGPIVHLGYGWGMIRGALAVALRREKAVRVRPPVVEPA